ncbi:family 43 glycosylhydrolase [Treponema sp. R80B11-R83G3]
MKKIILIGLVALALTLTLTACSNGNDNVPTGTAQVTFNSGYDGAPAIGPVTVDKGKAAADAWPDNPSRLGYDFGGWYSGENLYNAQTVINGDVSLTARWSAAASGLEDQPSAQVLAALFDTAQGFPANMSNSWKIWGHKNPLFTQAFGADPYAMVYDGRLYIYMSNDALEYGSDGYLSANPSYAKGIQGIRIISSSDLANWTDHGAVNIAGPDSTNPLVTNWYPIVNMQGVNASWAPTAAWKNVGGKPKFYLYWANSGNGIGVVMSNSPTGPWSSPLGDLLISRSTPNCATVEYLFDPGVFIDDDGDAYLFFGGGGSGLNPGHARRVKLNSDMISLAQTPETWYVPFMFEASDMKKFNGVYYFSYSVNNGSGNIAYMKSTAGPMSGFSETATTADVILVSASTQLSSSDSNVHHSMFEFKGKTYMSYHTQKVGEAMGVTRMRTASIDLMPINEDGTISPITMTRKGVEQVENLNPYVPNEAETIGIQGGIYTRPLNAASNKTLVTSIDTGDWLALYNVDFGAEGAKKFIARVRTPEVTSDTPADYSGAIEIRIDPQGAGVTEDDGNLNLARTARITGGEVVGRAYIKAKSGETGKFQTVTVDLDQHVTGVHNLVFVFYSSRGVHPETVQPDSRHKNCFEFDQWQFER